MTARGATAASGLTDHVREVMNVVSATNGLYRVNFQSGLPNHPIPFFGNITTAKVLTIGVNPSAGEFIERSWPEQLDAESLTERLLRYFDALPGPHPWFKPWIEALAVLGIDYARGEAAHLDLSPRATVNMRSVPDTDVFLGMVSQDIGWLVEFIQKCSSARLLMAAGTVTNRWYLNQFLARHARRHRFELLPPPRSSDRCALYQLSLPDRKLPLFFSSTSPSEKNRAHVLLENVRSQIEQLRPYLN